MKDILIPVVDCSAILGPFGKVREQDYEKVAKHLGAAMGGIGFAFLVNHGVNISKLDKIYELSRDFFQLPEETKRKYRKSDPKKSFHGYAGPGDELLNEKEKNSIELREIMDIWGLDAQDESKFPKEVPQFKAAIDDIRKDTSNFAKKLLRCLGKHLKMEDEDFFVKRHRNLDDRSVKTQTQFRTLYYYTLNPEANIPPNAIRCGEHSDWGTITMLFQDMVGGLEVKTSTGAWIPATPVKDAILLNCGQLLELWTGGKLHAAIHRVRILKNGRVATDPRQSFIYSVNPDGDTEVSPILPIAPGKETFSDRLPVNAYEHYQRLIADATY